MEKPNRNNHYFAPTTIQPIPLIFAEYVDFWLSAYKQSDVRRGTYSRMLEARKVLGSYAIAFMRTAEITYMDVKAYLNALVEHGYAKTTIKKQLSIVTAPLRFAAANHWISADPTAGISIPSSTHIVKPDKNICAYEGEEYHNLRILLETEAHDAYCAALLMIETGMRPGEVIALDWVDMLQKKRAIRIHKTAVRDTATGEWFMQNEPKTAASNRIVPLSKFAFDMVIRLHEQRQEGQISVFCSVNDERMSYESFRYQINKACERVNVPYKGLHIFRHTFATRQFYKGTSIKILSRLLGHSSVQVTYDTYIHLYGDALEEMREAVG